MESQAIDGRLLPRELLELQVGEVDLLMAMYPDEGSVVLSDVSEVALQALKQWLAADSASETPSSIPETIDLVLLAGSAPAVRGTGTVELRLSVSVPLRFTEDLAPTEPPPAKVRIQQAYEMSKAETAQLLAKATKYLELFAMVEYIGQYAALHLAMLQDRAADSHRPPVSTSSTSLSRVWFYFPSISTRSKRDDLVNNAPAYALTGFLLAGKPGILCLEGDSQAIDDYMKFIKTESWGDIPSHHKKVSEKYRQAEIEARTFPDMQEITDQLERRGERANRNDMQALELWLSERGLKDAFSKVLI